MSELADDNKTGGGKSGNVPKYHHYVSRLLLRAFATPPRDEGKLFTFDKERASSWSSTPRTTGGAKHHNRVDTATHSNPLVWEDSLAAIEGKAGTVVAAMRDSGALPDQEGFHHLVSFIAALHVGSPRSRRRLEGVYLQQMERHTLSYTINKSARKRFRQQRERLVKELTAQGKGMNASLERFISESPEESLARLKSGDFTVEPIPEPV
jgi:hypothetical protein